MIRRSSPPARSKMPKRSTKPIARSRVRSVNRARKAKNFLRAYGGSEYRAFVVSLPCLVCQAVPSEPSHISNGGAGRKSDADHLTPMCARHHREYHAGRLTFAKLYGWDTADLIAYAANVAQQFHADGARRGEW